MEADMNTTSPGYAKGGLMPATTTSAPKFGFRPKPLAAAVAIACLALSAPARPDILNWTGNAPVYLASWYNGSYTEYHEFQYYLDWQGYCNAHFGANCSALTFWGSKFNWDLNRLPTATDDVVTPAGSDVLISSYNSIYQGFLSGDAYANNLSAGGRVTIGWGALYVNSASFADLALGVGGVLNSGGMTQVDYLSAASGSLQGSGTTSVNTMGAVFFQPTVASGHTLVVQNFDSRIYVGSPRYTGFSPTLEANAALFSQGDLSLGNGQVWLGGSINLLTPLPSFTNSGHLDIGGNFDISAVRFYNAGTIQLTHDDIAGWDGRLTAFGGGTHSGNFLGDAGSEMIFTGFGGTGHVFQSGSNIATDGRLVFDKSGHRVSGFYRAAETELRGGADVTFDGNVSFLDRVIGTDGTGRLQTASGVHIGELTVNGFSRFFFNTGAPSQIDSVTLNSGAIGGSQTVTINGPLHWNGGSLTGTIYANGGIEMGAGALGRGFQGYLRNNGTANWNDGSFIQWLGTFDNPAGQPVDLKGDFRAGTDLSTIPGSSAFSGRFDNAGTFRKSAGSGTANLDMAFNNSGLVEVQSGTLILRGGGSHSGAFTAAPGARIELMGNTTITGPVTTSGRVDIKGHYWLDHTLTIANGGSYANAAGNSIASINVAIQPGGSLTNAGDMYLASASAPRSFTNAGSFTNQGSFYVDGPSTNSGSFNNTATGYATLIGSNTGSITNAGVLSLGLTNNGSISNLGQIYSGDFQHAGTILNDGTWTNYGSFATLAGSTFTNNGSIDNQAVFHIGSGARVSGPGSYVQSDFGTTWVEGTLAAGGGIDIYSGLLKGTGTIEGNVTLWQDARWTPGNSPGTMTVMGSVTIYGDAYLSPGSGNLEIEFASPTLFDHIVATGGVTFNNATIDFVFLPGFTPDEGDSFTWLSAGNLIQNGWIEPHFIGLPADLGGSLSFAGGVARLDILQTLPADAYQIASSGSPFIGVGETAYNDIDVGGDYPVLDALQVSGRFINQQQAYLYNNGSLTIDAGGNVSNRGQMEIVDLIDNAGQLTNRSGATLYAYSGINNTGTITNQATMAVWGHLYNDPGAHFVNSGNLEAYGQIINQGEFVVTGTLNNNSWSLGPLYGTGSILNPQGGVFVVEAGGLVTGPGSYFQTDPESVTRVNGTLSASDITIWQGVLTGSGTLQGPVTLGTTWGAGATVQPGNSPGTLTIDGNLVANNSTFEIELAGPSLFDRLQVNGNASFNSGLVRFILPSSFDLITPDYMPVAGDSFIWLAATGSLYGLDTLGWALDVRFVDTDGTPWTRTLASGYSGTTTYNGLQISFTGDRIAFAAAVPEPETWALLLAGLGLIGFAARRMHCPSYA
jgi:hypothetical protein